MTSRGGFYYNTNGFAFHRLEDAARLLADLGYDGIAWTPDVHHLDVTRASPGEIDRFGRLLRELRLEVVIETGARFVLDPRRKHRPSLLDPPDEARRRLEFLLRCVDAAAQLEAPVVSVWSGTGPPGLPDDVGLERLTQGLRELCEYAASRDVRIGLEPEPGMAIERTDAWPRLRDRVGHPSLGLTLDVGHCLATREGDPADIVRTHAGDLVVLQLDDHVAGRHDHLAFGEGEVEFDRIAAAVREIGFRGPLEVELSRHSATAPATARASLAFLRRAWGPPGAPGRGEGDSVRSP